jgi:Domain of unknown function (DUF4157)
MGMNAERSSKANRDTGGAGANRATSPTGVARRSLSPAIRVQRHLGNQHAQRTLGPPKGQTLRTACRECEKEEERSAESVQVARHRRSLDVPGVQTADEARRRPSDVLEELGSGRPIEGSVRRKFETIFGKDFTRVRVHDDPQAAALTQRFGSLAFTVGNHIAFSSGSYRPGTLLGDALIAHELAHVVQQQHPAQMPDSIAADNGRHDALERDADGSAVRAVAALWRKGRRHLGQALQTAAPRLRSGVRLSLTACGGGQTAPCKVTGAFSSIPSGNVPATLSGTKLGAKFDMTGDFTPAVPECNNCACGEYRQYVKGAFKVNGTTHTHALCGTNLSETTMQEDCARVGGTDYKYGYRNNPFPNSKFTNSDQTTGCRFEGHDEPGLSAGSGAVLSVDLEFRGELIDTCDGNKVLASSTWTVKGTATVP